MARARIKFHSDGFRELLQDPGMWGAAHAAAREEAARLESETGVPYTVEKSAGWDGRAGYDARPEQSHERVEGLTHEQWMEEIWPRVGGPKYRKRGG